MGGGGGGKKKINISSLNLRARARVRQQGCALRAHWRGGNSGGVACGCMGKVKLFGCEWVRVGVGDGWQASGAANGDDDDDGCVWGVDKGGCGLLTGF